MVGSDCRHRAACRELLFTGESGDSRPDGDEYAGATVPVIAMSAGAALLALGGVLLARRRRSLS
ncbi:LPXTG cell wall anchor domain-containing protein [Microbacterium sp. LWH10-1.2]|uniref:LPXTG cell wall anchor domain-containing protein n=1 Tax=unclassified Microbacterium TaxID=2609290 RepID=UPI00313A0BA8